MAEVKGEFMLKELSVAMPKTSELTLSLKSNYFHARFYSLV